MTLFGVNLSQEETILRVTSTTAKTTNTSAVIVKQYVLQADRGDLSSKLVRLNGRKIRMRREDSLPPLNPQVEMLEDARQVEIRMPKMAAAFFVIEGMDAQACVDGE